MSSGPLSGITVIDLTRVLSGPYCTRVLADLGARVIKVEPPGVGDQARLIGPFAGDMSAYFQSLNSGKESIALDLKNTGDKDLFEKLLAHGDVLVENFRPGVLARLGFDWPRLQKDFPQLIYAAISGFGATGPLAGQPAYDMVVQAMGGIMSITGHEDGPPARVGASIGDIAAGLFASNAITAALVNRAQTGKGSQIDISMLDCQVAILENAVARYHTTGEVPQRLGARHPSAAPFDAFATADGYIVITAVTDEAFDRLCRALDRKDLSKRIEYADNDKRIDNQSALKLELERTLTTKTTDEWLDIFSENDVPAGPINSIAELSSHPQTTARNMILPVEGRGSEDLRLSGNPMKSAAIADPPYRRAAPELDQDRDTIIKEFGDD